MAAEGWASMRAPSSGSATDRDLPDAVMIRAASGEPPAALAEVLAVELKATSSTTAYADADEGEALERFADVAGALPYIGAKFKRPGGSREPYYLVPLDACRMTPSGNYGVPESDADERAEWLVYPETTAKTPKVVRV